MPPSAGHVTEPGNNPLRHGGGGGGGCGAGVTVMPTDCCALPPNATAVIVVFPVPSAIAAPVVDEATRVETTFTFDDCQVKDTPGIGAPAASNACAVNRRPPFMGIVALVGETVSEASTGSALTSNRSYVHCQSHQLYQRKPCRVAVPLNASFATICCTPSHQTSIAAPAMFIAKWCVASPASATGACPSNV